MEASNNRILKKIKVRDILVKEPVNSVPGRVLNDGGSDPENQPNLGKDLTDAEKAELGGAGSGTPDGRTVIVRKRSTDGRATLEIQSGKNRIKFRYDE
ncbi:hypothetical protein FS594_10875 [Rahnella aquatilis]|nr:hypothetical protein FS594_10875 [Rahnella aquatilis]